MGNGPNDKNLYFEYSINMGDSIQEAIDSKILKELKNIITLRNIKQKDICEALNLSQSYTSELMSGKKEMSLLQLEKICEAFEIEIKLVDKYR